MVCSSRDSQRSTVRQGRLRLLGEVGAGTFSKVHKGVIVQGDHTYYVAVKRMRIKSSWDKLLSTILGSYWQHSDSRNTEGDERTKRVSRQEARQEVGILKELQGCQFILHYYGQLLRSRALWIITELCSTDLAELFSKLRNSCCPAVAMHYAVPVVDALNFIHERGFVHCDIKPENVLLTNIVPTVDMQLDSYFLVVL